MADYIIVTPDLGTAPLGTGGDDQRSSFTQLSANWISLSDAVVWDETTNDVSLTNKLDVNTLTDFSAVMNVSNSGIVTTPLMALVDLGGDGTHTQIGFHNFDVTVNLVGSITTLGSATSYNTSSDPRLKSEFTPFDATEAWKVFDAIYEASGTFYFLNDPDKQIWGSDAHRLIDLDLGLATEGQGPRDLKIGATYDTVDHPAIFTEKNVVIKEAWTEELKVTPAGMDNSKTIPHLLAVIRDLRCRIEILEDK